MFQVQENVEVYAYLEYLSKLNDGRDNRVPGIVDFLKTYFAPLNPVYGQIPYTLTVMLRHGGFHTLSPKILRIKDVDVVTILGRGRDADHFVFQDESFEHLRPKDILLTNIEFWSPEAKRRVRGTLRALWIPVSVKALYRDLRLAVEHY